MVVKNAKGREILLAMVGAVHENKQYLGDIDGLIGDGDHGMNMNKGFVHMVKDLGITRQHLRTALRNWEWCF